MLNTAEEAHGQALATWLELVRRNYRVILTDWVVAETGNGLARSRARDRFDDFVRQMMDAPSVEFVIVDRDLIVRALPMYRQRADKAWGLVDCARFVVMQDRGIADAFTSDRHFEQAGFTCLLTT